MLVTSNRYVQGVQLTLNVEIGYLHLMSTFTNFIPKNKVSEKLQSELRNRQRLSRVILNVATVFLQSDAMASIFFTTRYCGATI